MQLETPALGDESQHVAALLRQVEAAPGGRLGKGEANARLTATQKRAGLTPAEANRLRAELVAAGHLAAERTRQSESYTLTESGAARLGELRGLLPAAPGVRPPANERVRLGREAFLLMQLLRAPGRRLTLGEANRFGRVAAEVLDLDPRTARHVRGELTAAGHLAVERAGRSETYALTPSGRLHLGGMTGLPDLVFPMSGEVLADLLAAAREGAGARTAATATAAVPPPDAAPDPAGVESAVVAAFAELLRERYAVSGLVPIHAVRAEVRRVLGEAAARHDVFDGAVLSLWRAKRLSMTPIADPGRAAPGELQDSIPGVGETLFYLEAAREAAPV